VRGRPLCSRIRPHAGAAPGTLPAGGFSFGTTEYLPTGRPARTLRTPQWETKSAADWPRVIRSLAARALRRPGPARWAANSSGRAPILQTGGAGFESQVVLQPQVLQPQHCANRRFGRRGVCITGDRRARAGDPEYGDEPVIGGATSATRASMAALRSMPVVAGCRPRLACPAHAWRPGWSRAAATRRHDSLHVRQDRAHWRPRPRVPARRATAGGQGGRPAGLRRAAGSGWSRPAGLKVRRMPVPRSHGRRRGRLATAAARAPVRPARALVPVRRGSHARGRTAPRPGRAAPPAR
jgi:hypothetical protein